MDKKTKFPFVIFPEGTTTNGSSILKFKKGAFQALLPVKPFVIKEINKEGGNSVAFGSYSLGLYLIMTYSSLYHRVIFNEMPIIRPTRHMFDLYRKTRPELKEDWEIFAECTRDIMCEVGQLRHGTKTFRDLLKYVSVIRGKEVSNT